MAKFALICSRKSLHGKAARRKDVEFARRLLRVSHPTAWPPPLPPPSAPNAGALPEPFRQYDTGAFFRRDDGRRRHRAAALPAFPEALSRESVPQEFDAKRQAVDLAFLRQGITFNVYGDAQGAERIFPFDLVPRIIPADEWEQIERGLVQRITALNLFLHDIYHEQHILKDGVIPRRLRDVGQAFPARVRGLRGAARHLHPRLRHRPDPRRRRATTSCWRTTAAARPASATCWRTGRAMKRAFPEMFEAYGVRPVEDYPHGAAQDCSSYIAPAGVRRPDRRAAHARRLQLAPTSSTPILARQMGIEIVEGRDLVVRDERVFMRTTKGLQPVRCHLPPHRRRFPRPARFSAATRMLGVPGLVNAYRAGNVSLANSIGTGIADDKVIYLFRAAHDQLLPRPGADPAERADLPRQRGGRPEVHPGEPATSWWSRRSTSPAATAC